MTTTPSLSVVIPVWNLPTDLSNLLRQIGTLGIFDEIIVADDGSNPSCDPGRLGFDDAAVGGRLVYLQSQKQLGAGNARNRGLRAVTSDYTLFFDADDRMDAGLKDIWAAVYQHLQKPAGHPMDFAMFRHADTRITTHQASFAADERIWDRAVGTKDSHVMNIAERAHLSGVAAYPWNKIYRTSFLRDNAISCTESSVHNDLALHWISFIHAKHILALRTIGATHVVHQTGAHHLTNRTGQERFCVFGIFDDVLARIRTSDGHQALFAAHFLNFAFDLLRWIKGRIDISLKQAFADTARDYLIRNLSENEFNSFALWQPEKASQMVQFLNGRRDL